MFATFVHFSPKDENTKVYSGNWKLKDLRVINVNNFITIIFKMGYDKRTNL